MPRTRQPLAIAFVSLWVALGSLGALAACSSAPPGANAAPPDDPEIPVGADFFVYDEYEPLSDKPLTVWTYRPAEGAVDEMPIVVVMHGFGRDGKAYRDAWIRHAEAHRFLLLVPTFDATYYPGGDGYNLGGVVGPNGTPTPEAEWAFSAIEPLFDDVVERTGSQEDGYHLFGHSAGSQFVHRFLMFKPDNRVRTAVAANAGWYTLPRFDTAFPYGLEGAPTTQEHVGTALGTNVVVLLGEDDDNPDDESLRTTPEAMEQGAHRLERGKTFYREVEAAAERFGVPLQWTLQTVPNVGHDGEKMAEAAAELLFGASSQHGADTEPDG